MIHSRKLPAEEIMSNSKILMVYTGGTIGMYKNPETGALAPVDFSQISAQVPELKKFDFRLDAISFDPVIDSSNVTPTFWQQLALTIADNYDKYDGFVVLHGTDTMSYTASALSFMLTNLLKPIILTGSQLPIGTLRSDGKLNLITALEIAAAKHKGKAIVPEVCVYFENHLYRGNRTSKQNAEFFDAFRSSNYPPLAEVGINIRYNYGAIRVPKKQAQLEVTTALSADVAILKLFPGMSAKAARAIINSEGLKAIVLESYGAGNAPTDSWFLELIEEAVSKNIIVLNITQCSAGSVMMGHYDTSVELMQLGVLSGKDLTTEAAVTKLMLLLGKQKKLNYVKELIQQPLAGEMSAV